MKKNLTELVFILDRSGSMGGLEQDTIGGFNAMLTRQKEQEGEANVTTILFDHEVQLLHDRFSAEGCCAADRKGLLRPGLHGAAGCHWLWHGKDGEYPAPSAGERACRKVIFVITTDGLENASKRFGYEKIRRMIEREKRTIRLGVPVPRCQHGRREGSCPLRHRGRPGGAV